MERNDFPNLKPVDLYTWDENIGGNGTVKFMAFYEKKGSPVSLNKVEQIVRSAVALHEGPLNTAGYTAKVERIAEHVENDVRISNGVFVTFERLKTD